MSNTLVLLLAAVLPVLIVLKNDKQVVHLLEGSNCSGAAKTPPSRLDFAERYRNLPYIAILKNPEMQ